MEKLPMCRVCLAENVRMYIVVNRNLHNLYEKLTDIPFVTEDSRPILACFVCCTKLKQCYRLLRQCLEAEERFAQMMNEDFEPNCLINHDHLEAFTGFIKSPIVHISIYEDCQTGSIAIKEELPAVCEGLDDIIEPKEEHQSDELELDNSDNRCLAAGDIPIHHSESDLEDDVSLMKFKTELDEEQVSSKRKRRARKTKRETVAKKPKLDTRKIKPEDAITAEETEKSKSDSKVIWTTQKRTSKAGTYFKEPYKCDQQLKYIQHTRTHTGVKTFTHTGEKPLKCDVCQLSFRKKTHLTEHIRTHTGEKPFKCDICQRSFSHKLTLIQHIRIHTGEKPFKCDVCQRSFSQNGSFTRHIRIHTRDLPQNRCMST